jgi:hypothetical protein
VLADLCAHQPAIKAVLGLVNFCPKKRYVILAHQIYCSLLCLFYSSNFHVFCCVLCSNLSIEETCQSGCGISLRNQAGIGTKINSRLRQRPRRAKALNVHATSNLAKKRKSERLRQKIVGIQKYLLLEVGATSVEVGPTSVEVGSRLTHLCVPGLERDKPKKKAA